MSLKAIKSVDYVVLACNDLEQAREFYSHVLGLQIACEREDWIKFQVGSTALALRPETGSFENRAVKGPAVQLAFEVPHIEVDRCYRELASRNLTIIEEPRDQAWGHRTLFFLDPEGNVLEIYARIE